jgi:hypothetical protein
MLPDDWLPTMSRLLVPSVLLALALAAVPVLGAGAVESLRTEGEVTWAVEPLPTPDGQRRTFEYAVDPGTQIVDSVVITNLGETSAEFLIYATDAINEPETGAFGLLERGVDPTDVGGWITLASETLTIEPGQQATVPFNLLVPSDAAPGEHVAGIVASVLTIGENEDGSEVTLEQRVGARVYLNVSGAATAGLEIRGITSSYTPELNPFAPGTVSVSFDVANTGNQRLDAVPRLSITGPFGIPLGEFNPEAVTELLPRQSVRVSADVPAIAALALVFTNVTVVPGPVGSAAQAAEDAIETEEPLDGEETPAAEETPDPTPSPEAETDSETVVAGDEDVIVVSEDQVVFEPVSESAPALAVSWTLLALLVLVGGGVYVLWRYISGTRERLYLAIDEASEAARQQAAIDRRPEDQQ